MAKDKEQKQDTWGSRMKDFGGGDFMFLSEDGESVICIVVGLPELLKGKYKNQDQERIGIPIVTEDGFVLLVGGKRLARRLSKHEKQFNDTAFCITRIGAANDTNAKYPVKPLPEKETFDRLKEIAVADFKPDMIEQAIKDVSKVLMG